jgi:hypothetical protein
MAVGNGDRRIRAEQTRNGNFVPQHGGDVGAPTSKISNDCPPRAVAERTAERAGLLNALHRVSHIGESPPHLQEVHHLSRTAAAPHASLLLRGVAIGAGIVGIFLGTGIL